MSANKPKKDAPFAKSAKGRCLCGAVEIEISVPVRWAWHDHKRASRLAHGAAYATYVGAWRSRYRIIKGGEHITRYVEDDTGAARSFCARCGTPLAYERAHAKQMVNIPRALFGARTGREPLYHVGVEELQEWTYLGAPLAPLKGFPGVVWEKTKRKKRVETDALFE
ncbi:MAG TPA: GFA family protein [Caulobacterales bacterium]|nr:GFA family protein [Caulobacterales bacterium]